MNLDELTLGDVKKLQCLLGKQSDDECCEKDHGIQIVILQRGWVMIGRKTQIGSNCKLSDARVIRRWGTSEGLGELAIKGPLSETKLEVTPEVTYHALTEIASIKCEESKWQKHLK